VPSCLPKLREAVAAMERNTRELHERVMGIRMLPIGHCSSAIRGPFTTLLRPRESRFAWS